MSVTQKISRPLTARMAREITSDFLNWNVVVNDGESIQGAIEIQSERNFSFWDSLLIQAAIISGAFILLSEDLSDGWVIHGVNVKNPFAGFPAASTR